MSILNSVLLVEDDEIAASHHQVILKDLTITRQIVWQPNGRKALDFIHNSYSSNGELPALILTDLFMPEMDGFEFIQSVKSSELLGVKRIPIGIVTVSANDLDVPDENIPFPLVSKPLDPFKLFHILHDTVIPLLSPVYQKVIIERQKYLEEQRAHLVNENHKLKTTLEQIKKRRQEIEEKLAKYKKGI